MTAMADDLVATKYLEPSKLGTRSYWDEYYQNDIANHEEDENGLNEPLELESWFDDVGAPAKILQYLTSDDFPLASHKDSCTVLDLGTGNGSTLFMLRLEGEFRGPLVGVDYSAQSVRLAETLKSRYKSMLATEKHKSGPITFDIFDVVTGDPQANLWWPEDAAGFDLVLDKGTFDAISLSPEQVVDEDGIARRLHEICPQKTAFLVRPGGFFLITSCNWTEDEIIGWFAMGKMSGIFEVFDKIKYKSFQFGGRRGQGVATVCFRRLS